MSSVLDCLGEVQERQTERLGEIQGQQTEKQSAEEFRSFPPRSLSRDSSPHLHPVNCWFPSADRGKSFLSSSNAPQQIKELVMNVAEKYQP